MLHGWLGTVEIVLIVIALIALALGVLAVRRRWLARNGGTFECSMRLRDKTPGTGWVLGVARYSGENLEWFRFFSYGFSPRKSFGRHNLRVVTSREPDPVEAVALYSGQQVIEIEEVLDPSAAPGSPAAELDPEQWELAMSEASLTGLLSWLESAPPGSGPHGLTRST